MNKLSEIEAIVEQWADSNPDGIDDLDAMCRIADVLGIEVQPRGSVEAPHAAQLERFKALESNWDSYDAPPIDARALEIAAQLSPVLADWQITPCSDGMIQFEKGWEEIGINTCNPEQQSPHVCAKCGHQERFSDNEAGYCEKVFDPVRADRVNEATCGCLCVFPEST